VHGEETNKLTGYLAAVSRKLDKPLAVVIQSSSSAGKTSLMDAVLKLIPDEEQIKYSAMTGQSLFYMGETNLKHKILAISEEEGIEQASYALKLLQSEGELRIASAGKNADTGRLGTEEYRVEGPVMLFLTTTASEVDFELVNRCLVLAVDEDRDQTRAIHKLQRQSQTLQGLRASRESKQIVKVHQDAQRLLRTVEVINPYAEQLTFLDDKTRMRRDHMKYLSLIRTIALLHQYQREIKTLDCGSETIEYIEVTPRDIALANGLAGEVLGRTLDELSPQARRLLLKLHEMVAEQCKQQSIDRCDYRFTRRDVREAIGWTDFQVRTHLSKLVQLEYALVHRGTRGQQFVYELLYDGQGREGQPFLMGLIDPSQIKQLANDYDEKFEGLQSKFEHSQVNNEVPTSIGCGPIEARMSGAKNSHSLGKTSVEPSSNGRVR
ncbi:DNA primase, partial [Planctomycetota bacterium]